MRFPFVRRKKYDELVYKLECLLCHATGGRLSKHTYTLQVMENAVTDYSEEAVLEESQVTAEAIINELKDYCTYSHEKSLCQLVQELEEKYIEGKK